MKRFDCRLGSSGFDCFSADMEETDFDGDWVRAEDALRLESHINEAMKLMRDSGADQREYVVYATLAAALNPSPER